MIPVSLYLNLNGSEFEKVGATGITLLKVFYGYDVAINFQMFWNICYSTHSNYIDWHSKSNSQASFSCDFLIAKMRSIKSE